MKQVINFVLRIIILFDIIGLPILSPPPPPPSGVVPQYINTGHHPPTHAVNRNINDPSLGNTTTVLREPSPPSKLYTNAHGSM